MTGADNQQERLDGYISGYVDGEGCFAVSIQRHPDTRFKISMVPEFQVSQDDGRIQVLEMIQKRLGCGTIKPNHAKNTKDNTQVLVVRDRRSLLDKIIPFFERSPLISIKQREFETFCYIVHSMEQGRHSTVEGFRELLKLAVAMNGDGKYRRVDWVATFEAEVQNPQRLHARRGRPALSKIQSELHGDMQSEAEMTSPLVEAGEPAIE